MTSVPIRLLLVEDNPGDADLVAAHLADDPTPLVAITHVPSCARALEQLAHARFDVVVLDLNLPDSAGLDTLHRVRAARGQAPIVILSGAIDEPLGRDARRAGAADVITKDELTSRLFSRSVLYVIERHRAEERQRQIERLVDTYPDAVLIAGLDGTARYVNAAAAALFDRSRKELLSESLGFSTREGEPTEIHILRRDGDRLAEVRVSAFCWDNDDAVLAICRDVTERKRTELQLAASDRMASMGTLAAGVAHEINNPLSAVIANLYMAREDLEALAKRVDLPDEVLVELSEATEAAERVRDIVRDLKLFSRAEEETRGPVDVERVLDSTIRMAWNEIRHRARLVKTFGLVPPVEANESRLGQVFLNLLVNAAQAIPEGRFDQNEIRVSTSLDAAGRVVITLADTGSGMPLEVQRRLFTPFFTTKPVGTGTGLGLAICHRIVTSFNGEISFESKEGRGTEFRVVLPPSTAEVPYKATPSAPPAPIEHSALRRGRVLVVDDDVAVRRVMERVVSCGHEVTMADGAVSALAMLVGGRAFDAILCDLMMPEMTGMEFYEEVRTRAPTYADRIIFMSGGAFTPRSRKFLDSVANHRIDKPVDLQRLRDVLGSLL